METQTNVSQVQLQAQNYDDFSERFVHNDPEFVPLFHRVLHCDETADRSAELIVKERAAAWYSQPFRKPVATDDFFTRGYIADDFTGFLYDGQNTELLVVTSAHGRYYGPLNGVDKQYKPENEVIHLQATCAVSGVRRYIRFCRADGHGTVSLGGERLGWILTEETSQQERALRIGAITIAS